MPVCEFGEECPLDQLILCRLNHRFQVGRRSQEIVKGSNDLSWVNKKWEEVELHRQAIDTLTEQIKGTKLCGVCPMQGKELG